MVLAESARSDGACREGEMQFDSQQAEVWLVRLLFPFLVKWPVAGSPKPGGHSALHVS